MNNINIISTFIYFIIVDYVLCYILRIIVYYLYIILIIYIMKL